MISMRLSVCSQAHTGRVRWQCTLYRRPSLCAANTATTAKQLTALDEDPTGLSRLEPAGLTWREINEDDALFDFNHRLASQPMKFEAKIISIL